MEEDRIGIPANLLNRDKGLRIPIQHWGEGLLVFDKPQSIGSKADPWYPKHPDLENAFRAQIPNEKPELIHHGVTDLSVFNSLEPEATGLVLASCSEDSRESWKNAFGSQLFVFHSIIITRTSNQQKAVDCNLPLARHFKNQRMMISHNLGKKTFTRFTPLVKSKTAEAWLASTRYPRLHQIRIHAREKSIPLLRDPLYDPTYPKDLFEEDRHKLDWIHQYAVQFDGDLAINTPMVKALPPKYWKRNLRRSELEIDEIIEKTDKILENITLPND